MVKAKRNKLKGHLIGLTMAKYRCPFEDAEMVYEIYLKKIFEPVQAVMMQMIIQKVHDFKVEHGLTDQRIEHN